MIEQTHSNAILTMLSSWFGKSAKRDDKIPWYVFGCFCYFRDFRLWVLPVDKIKLWVRSSGQENKLKLSNTFPKRAKKNEVEKTLKFVLYVIRDISW